MKINIFSLTIALAAFVLYSCNNAPKSGDQESQDGDTSFYASYEAQLQSLNDSVTGSKTAGNATFIIKDGEMQVTIDVKNAPAGIQHWQHFHGFENGDAAEVPTMEQDANGDGIIDVTETEPVSGTTMVPFNDIPANMDVGANSYPEADEEGSYHYEATIPMEQLDSVFLEAFGDEVNLDTRVLYIHGVPEDTELPESVASLGDIPASITIPIAAGKINKVEEE